MYKTKTDYERKQELVRVCEEEVRRRIKEEREGEKMRIKLFIGITLSLTIIITGLMVLVNYVNTL